MRDQMGLATFAAQYQQDPTSPDGGQFKWAWFQRINGTPAKWLRTCEAYISVDAAASTAETADYTAISVVLVTQGKFVAISAERARWDYEALRGRVECWLKHLQEKLGRPITLLIEAASAGLSLYPPMRRLALDTGKFNCHYYKPVVGKDTRVLLSIPAFVDRRVFLQDAPGLNELIEAYVNEFLAYPKGRFDDQVDSLTQLISYLMPRIYANERSPLF